MQAMEDLVTSEETRETYRYFMRTDPDMRDIFGPIERIDDPVTGQEIRVRQGAVAMMRGSEKLKPVKIYLDPIPHIRLEKAKELQGWYQGKHDTPTGGRERPCMTDAVLTEPYGGYCAVGCAFCYINSGFRGYRGSGLITVPIGYGDQIAKQLRSMKIGTSGYFSSFTDPFLPLEDYYHNTQSGATAFVNEGLPIFFLSRLSYPGWAFDLLVKNKYSYAQKSINTCDEADWKKLSPGAVSLSQHFSEIRELRKRGVYVSIQCNPIIAGITTHEEIETLFELLAEAGTNHVIVKFVEANHPWAKAMVEKITKRFGANRAAFFRDLFVENQCGGQKTITEEYRREGHERYRAKATQLGMTYSLCYEYTKKTGEWHSMGPEYLTADQCHGQRVPIHTRVDGVFKALDVCPPSGCLTCSTHACGSELLSSAKALKLSDFRRGV